MNKEEQKKLITEIMNEDAKDGLYEPAKTATEWLFVQLYERFEMKGDGREMDKVLEQAKAMEKKQIINAHLEGWSDAYDYLQDNGSKPARQAEEYYNETYNK